MREICKSGSEGGSGAKQWPVPTSIIRNLGQARTLTLQMGHCAAARAVDSKCSPSGMTHLLFKSYHVIDCLIF